MQPDELASGIALFNSEKYFEAHEVLEDVWRAAAAEDKRFLQGLIQIAVALHHHGRGNIHGARSLLARAQRNLEDYPDSYAGVNLIAVRAAIVQCQHALDTALPLATVKVELS